MDIRDYISSGIIEEYVLGGLSKDAAEELQRLSAIHEEIRFEIELAERALEEYLNLRAVQPPEGLRNQILGTIESVNEAIDLENPPLLSKHSDSDQWYQAVAHIDPPGDYDNIHLHQIVGDPEKMIAKAWVKNLVPNETHDDLLESFLILEGTCQCQIGNKTYDLGPGDYLEIPLHTAHTIKITSDRPVVAILQKVAA